MPPIATPLGRELSKATLAQKKLINLETFSTPREFMAAVERHRHAGETAFAEVLDKSFSMEVLRHAPELSTLQCETETRFARLYSAPGTRRRRLLIAFTGVAMRLMMPLPIFMQAMPKDTDLLILYDPQRNHFRSGIWDGTLALSDLVAVAAPVIGAYGDAISLGTSGGGFPALRFAKQSGLRRGLSFGGRQIDDTLGLMRGQAAPPAFDPLCACDRRTGTEAALIYAALNAHDSAAARCAAVAANSHLIPLADRVDHGVLWALQRMGQLPALLDLAFDASMDGLRDALTLWNAQNPPQTQRSPRA